MYIASSLELTPSIAPSRAVPLVGAEFGLSSADWQVRGRLKRCDADRLCLLQLALPFGAFEAVNVWRRRISLAVSVTMPWDAREGRRVKTQDEVDDGGEVLARKKLGVLTKRFFWW